MRCWQGGLLAPVLFLAAACGGDDDDGTGTGGTGGQGSGGQGDGGQGGSGTPGELQAVGTCTVGPMCMLYECDPTAGASCENAAAGYPTGCASASGTWAAGAICPTAESVGSCRVTSPAGAVTTTAYASSGISVDANRAACEQGGGTFISP